MEKTLYVKRDVIEPTRRQIYNWAKKYVAEPIAPEELHVTIMYSKNKLVWPEPKTKVITLGFNAFNRKVELLGENKTSLVLMLKSSILQSEWQSYIDAGAEYTWPQYLPHISLSYKSSPEELAKFKKDIFIGPIKLGPQTQQEVDEDYGK